MIDILCITVQPRLDFTLKSICVEFDLHKVVITLSYFTEIQSFIPLDSLLKSASIYNYAVELINIFHVEVPGILVNHKNINEANN